MTSSQPEHASPDETWRLPASWLALLVFVMTALTVAGVIILIRTLNGQPGPPLWFLALWFILLGWNVYWWLFRVAYRVELVGRTLHWRAPCRAGSIPADSIEKVGRYFGSRNTSVLRGRGHPSVVVFTQLRSFTPILEALNRLNPAVPVRH